MDERTCADCGTALHSRYSTARYCSPRCRNRAKYERGKVSGLEQRKRERRNARYVPKEPSFRGECRVCGAAFRAHVETQRYCSPRCRRLNAWRTEAKRGREHFEVGGLSNGEPLIVRAEPSRAGGWIVLCPFHKGRCFMGARHGVDAADERWCPACDRVFKINVEELSVLATGRAA